MTVMLVDALWTGMLLRTNVGRPSVVNPFTGFIVTPYPCV